MSNFRMCSNCGKDNNYTFNFCSNCGMQLSENNIGNNELYNAVQSKKANDAIFNQNNKLSIIFHCFASFESQKQLWMFIRLPFIFKNFFKDAILYLDIDAVKGSF